jgi:sugar O-acyltransferase (sialic acid O-acetyltransferase NeuD family)
MRDILIYGFGGFGHEVACLINHINRVKPTWNIVGYIDDGVGVGTECKYGKVLGNIDTLNNWPTPISVVIAIGSCKYLKLISEKIKNPNVDFPNIIAPNVFYFDEDNIMIGHGNIVTFGCRFSCNTKLGNFNILNGNISLGHDASLGDYNVLFPETRISGQTTIGNGNFFGARTFVAQCLTVGNSCRFGAGTFVLRKVKDGCLYMGNPARKIEI